MKLAKYSDLHEGVCKDCGKAMDEHFINLDAGPEVCADQIICPEKEIPRWLVVLFIIVTIMAAYGMSAELLGYHYRSIMWETDHTSIFHKWLRHNDQFERMLSDWLMANECRLLKGLLYFSCAGWAGLFGGGILLGIMEEGVDDGREE